MPFLKQSEFLQNLARQSQYVPQASTSLFLRCSRNFSLIGFDYNGIAIFDAKDIFLAPSFQFNNQNTFSGHENTDIKFAAKDLTVPVNDIMII